MLKKAILLICDGLGDRPIKELGYRTPLEAASTPNLDRLAERAECGVMCALGRGIRPGSDVSTMAILGYDPKEYYSGRGPIEASGIGIELMAGDVALRGNFGTIDEGWRIRDRRAGRILEVGPLAEALNGMIIDDVEFIVKPGTAHRAGVVLRGKGISDAFTDTDPHEMYRPVYMSEAKQNKPEALKTAGLINKFSAQAHDILKEHPFNKEREAQGLLPANFLLLRGAGQYRGMPKFQERYGLKASCIAGGGLYKGVGSMAGMKIVTVEQATGLADTNIHKKFTSAIDQLQENDFVFLHVKATDTLAEDGNFLGKRDFIERIDEAADLFLDLPDDVLLIVTADHSTPCELKQHSADPVPIMFCGGSVRTDSINAFNERACALGGLGFITGLDIMPQVMNLLGKTRLSGA